MKARLINRGDFTTIRLPKKFVEKAKLPKEVEVYLLDDELVIRSGKKRNPREGWQESFAEMAKNQDDQLLDEPTPTQWDETEWQW